MAKSFWAWGLCGSYIALVFFLAVIPGSDIPEVVYSFSDKQLHALQYFLLFMVTVHALGYSVPEPVRRYRGAAAVLWSLTAGAWTEILQSQTPGRSAEMFDWLADAGGILAGYLVWAVWNRTGFGRQKRVNDGNF